jgi:tetratricopeptide (TPR) repeat protein
LSDTTTELLRVAAAFTGGIDFEVTRRVADLEELAALDALDAALGAQLLVAAGGQKPAYDFTHALVRHTVYEGLSPARQARLHRQIAEAMEAVYGERAVDHAAAIARHYHRSATLPGAERGVPHCVAAADRAERSAAFADVIDHLRIALDLLPATAPERPRLLARRALALARTLRFDDAVAAAHEAARGISETEGPDEAAEYLADVVMAFHDGGASSHVASLVREGREYVGERHHETWAMFSKAVAARTPAQGARVDHDYSKPWFSREEIIAQVAYPECHYLVGEYRRGVSTLRALPAEYERQGRLVWAAATWAIAARFHIALGEFTDAHDARRRGAKLAQRVADSSLAAVHLLGAEGDWRLAMDEGWYAPLEQNVGPRTGRAVAWHRANFDAAVAQARAHMGDVEPAMRRLVSVLPAIERAPGWNEDYVSLACDAAATLWLTERTDHIDVLERNLREKVVEPDFRFPMKDGRLALARLCALQGRDDEAIEWFAKARTVLDEQGARPLRAIVDYDEALMYARRGAPGDPERAWPLLDAALRQFRTLGMPGWIRRAEALLKSGAAGRQESGGALR